MIEFNSRLKKFLVLLFVCTGIVISVLNVEGREPLPREFKGVALLMTPQEVKKALLTLKLRFKEETGVDNMGVSYHMLVIRDLMPGFQIAGFHFYEGKLAWIHLDHHLLEVPVPFELFLSALEENYGRPAERESPIDMFGHKSFIYLWKNEQTGLKVLYAPPGPDPFGRPASGALNWTIYDKDLSEKEKKERAEKLAALKEKMKRK